MSLSRWSAGLAALVLIFGSQSASAQNKLEPTAPPGPTMKTLDEIPPTWSLILPAAQRFQLVMGGDAVLDKETGLVWQREVLALPEIWADASNGCYALLLGGRLGWRLPAVEELLSLLDPTGDEQNLPTGNLFGNIGTLSSFWTATTVGAGQKYIVRNGLAIGDGQHAFFADRGDPDVISNRRAWCVRGGRGHDGQ